MHTPHSSTSSSLQHYDQTQTSSTSLPQQLQQQQQQQPQQQQQQQVMMNNAPADYATPRPSVENTGSKMDVDSAAVAAGKFTFRFCSEREFIWKRKEEDEEGRAGIVESGPGLILYIT